VSSRILNVGRDRVPDGIPWSAGALVDRAGLKGARVGGASVSTTTWQFHRQRRFRAGSRHSASHRSMSLDGQGNGLASIFVKRIVYLGDFEES